MQQQRQSYDREIKNRDILPFTVLVWEILEGYDSLVVGVTQRNSEIQPFAGLRGRRLLLQGGSPTALPCARPTRVFKFSPLCPKGSS
jgi:hypothetical protein